MIHRFLVVLTFSGLLPAFMNIHAELPIALISSSNNRFDNIEYNNAKIREACIDVLGKEWFKEKILCENGLEDFEVTLSNSGTVEIQSSDGSIKSLLEIKTVLDYMSKRGETLYLSVNEDIFSTLSDTECLNEYLRNSTFTCCDSIVFNPQNKSLRIVGYSHTDVNPVMIKYGPVKLSCLRDEYGNQKDYKAKCQKEEYTIVGGPNQPNIGIRKEDTEICYERVVAYDKCTLEAGRPESSICAGVYYDSGKPHSVYFIVSEFIE